MTDETLSTPETPETPAAPTGAAAYTDEQLTAAFPGQDVAHIRSMLNKQAGVTEPTTPTPADPPANPETPETPDGDVTYPEWIPEKFRQGTVEQAMEKMAGAYKVLEGARGTPSDPPADPAGDPPGDGDADTSPPTVQPLDLRALESEYVKNGSKITPEMVESVKKAGLDEAFLESYIAGQQAVAQQLVTKVHALVDGPANYEAMLQWMVGNLPKGEVEAYDAAMETGKEATIAVAVRGVYAAYQAAVGTDAVSPVTPMTGKPTQNGFQSKREMIEAMKDPRYQKDEAYRQEVAQRIKHGNVW